MEERGSAVAMRQLADYAKFSLPKPANETRLPAHDLSPHLRSKVLSEAEPMTWRMGDGQTSVGGDEVAGHGLGSE